MDVIGFEAYDGGSHRAVRLSIDRHSRHRWRWVTRPPRAWKWRMRIGAIELVDQAVTHGHLGGPVDMVFATSLVAASDLRAALPRRLRATPLMVYMHENQIAYPAGHAEGGQAEGAPAERDVQFALTNLTSILTADAVLWNSTWNLESFIEGMAGLLRHAPDGRLEDVEGRIRRRSEVIWPPVEMPEEALHNPPDLARALHKPVHVVWPHRWEHDKGPDELLDLARRLSEPLDLRWTILGERFRQVPPALEAFRESLPGRVEHFGYVESREDYWNHLVRSDWVLSTARHEFFGIAVVEAMLAGCLPWLPDRLSYPELLPTSLRGIGPEQPPDDPPAARRAILEHLDDALAPNAVRRIDDALDRVAQA